jgi:hypothetical protein
MRDDNWLFVMSRYNRWFLMMSGHNCWLFLLNWYNGSLMLRLNVLLNIFFDMTLDFFFISSDIARIFRNQSLLLTFFINKDIGLSFSSRLPLFPHNRRLNLSHCSYLSLPTISISRRQANIRCEMGRLRSMKTVIMAFIFTLPFIFVVSSFAMLMNYIFSLGRYCFLFFP